MADWATFSGVVGVVLVLLLVLARASTAVLSDEPQPSRGTDSADGVGGGPGRGAGPGSSDDSTADRGRGSDADQGDDSDADRDGEPTDGPTADPTAELADGSVRGGHPGPPAESQPPQSPTENGHLDGPVSPRKNGHLDASVSGGEPADSATPERSRPVESRTAETPQSVDEQSVPTDEQSVPTDEQSMPTLSTLALLANVAASQGVFAVLLVTMAWYTEIPASAFGLAAEGVTLAAVGAGVAFGCLLYGLNEAATAVGRWRGIDPPERLREALAPETAGGWLLLLVVVLPIIAGFEELLFRGALIGVVNAGFGVSPWLLAVGSSVAFALGHGAQGRFGIVVTGLLGLALAAVFVLTGSLLVVIVAHYVVNALEFVVQEGGVE